MFNGEISKISYPSQQNQHFHVQHASLRSVCNMRRVRLVILINFVVRERERDAFDEILRGALIDCLAFSRLISLMELA